MKALTLAINLMVGILSVGCRAEIPGTGVPGPTSATQVEASPTPAGVVQAPSQVQSALKRRDVPPAGVEPQLAVFTAGGDGTCTIDVTEDGRGTARVEIAETATICFSTFKSSEPIRFEVRGPDGQTTNGDIDADTGSRVFWNAGVGDALGKYTVTGVQGARRAVGQLDVILAQAPRMRVDPFMGRAETKFAVALAGYQPQRQIPVHVYRFSEQATVPPGQALYTYLTTLPPVTTSARGEATLSLATAGGDPMGSYLLRTEPPVDAWRLGSFRLGEP